METITAEREVPAAPAPVTIADLQARIAEMRQAAADASGHTETEEEQQAREVRQTRAYLLTLGFPARNCLPALDATAGSPGIPAEWQDRFAAFLTDVPGHVNRGEGPYLGGAVGRGKTCALALIALAAREHDISCEYVLCGADLVWACEQFDARARAKAGRFGDEDPSFDPARKPWPFTDTRLLLLDDIDLGKGAGFDPDREHWDVVSRFLYARMARGLSTAIATNLRWDSVQRTAEEKIIGLVDKPGMDRVASRWQETIPPGLRFVARREDQRGR